MNETSGMAKTQREAALRAWEHAEAAEAALIENDYAEAAAYADVARAWAAVAGQFEFISPASVPVDVPLPAQQCDTLGCVLTPHVGPHFPARIDEPAQQIEDTLRINPMAAPAPDETAVLPRIGPAWQGPPQCACERLPYRHDYSTISGCRG